MPITPAFPLFGEQRCLRALGNCSSEFAEIPLNSFPREISKAAMFSRNIILFPPGFLPVHCAMSQKYGVFPSTSSSLSPPLKYHIFFGLIPSLLNAFFVHCFFPPPSQGPFPGSASAHRLLPPHVLPHPAIPHRRHGVRLPRHTTAVCPLRAEIQKIM